MRQAELKKNGKSLKKKKKMHIWSLVQSSGQETVLSFWENMVDLDFLFGKKIFARKTHFSAGL